MDNPTGQSPEAVMPQAPQAPEVQSTPQPDPQVIAYRKIQAERDAAIASLQTLEDYKKVLPHKDEQIQKQNQTIKQLESQLVVKDLVASNPHLKEIAGFQDFSGMSTDEINAWGEKATKAILAAAGKPSSPEAPQTPQAPEVQSGKGIPGNAQPLSEEAFAALPLPEKKKYLQAMGM